MPKEPRQQPWHRRLVMLKVTTPQHGRVAHRGLDDIITTTSALWGLRTI